MQAKLHLGPPPPRTCQVGDLRTGDTYTSGRDTLLVTDGRVDFDGYTLAVVISSATGKRGHTRLARC